MRIDSSGRVGIGTTSPSSLLHVQDAGVTTLIVANTSNSSGLELSGSSTTGEASIGARFNNSQLLFRTAGASGGNVERARIDSSGRVGIGTTSPQAKFHLDQATADENSFRIQNEEVALFAGAYGTSSTYGRQFIINASRVDNGSFPELRLAGQGGIIFAADANSERMRIDNAGNMMVSTTTYGTTNTEGFNVTYAGGSTYSTWGHKNGTSAGQPWCVFSYNGGPIGSITQNGTTGASFNTTSDYRLKENIVPLTGAAARLSQIPVHRFNFIADPDRTVDGFIAHEAQAVVPECVTGEKDAVDDDGNPVYQGIDQSKLVPLLTAALQEALAKIENLEQRLNDAGIA
jgi:hypothetical protein